MEKGVDWGGWGERQEAVREAVADLLNAGADEIAVTTSASAGINSLASFEPFHELFAATGDIRVSDSVLHITLAPLSSPHRTLAAKALCETLDQTATIFPRLRVCFSVRPPPRIGLAFPGSPVERSTATAVPPAP
jgi:hypothetical protein